MKLTNQLMCVSISGYQSVKHPEELMEEELEIPEEFDDAIEIGKYI